MARVYVEDGVGAAPFAPHLPTPGRLRQMKAFPLLLLRISLGWLMVVWGVDKLTNPSHGQAVAESFYFGMGSGGTFLTVAGAAQVLLGGLLVLGLVRRVAWPLVALVTGITLIAVWKSIVDPWGFVIEGGNVVFYSSAVIFAGVLVGWSAIEEDTIALDRALKLE